MGQKRTFRRTTQIGGDDHIEIYSVYLSGGAVAKFTRKVKEDRISCSFSEEQRIPKSDVPDCALEKWSDNLIKCAEKL